MWGWTGVGEAQERRRARRHWASRDCGEGLLVCCWYACCSTLESGTADGRLFDVLCPPLCDRDDGQVAPIGSLVTLP